MSLLHATWLHNLQDPSNVSSSSLFLWADQWQLTTPKESCNNPCSHPFALSSKALRDWLSKKQLMDPKMSDASACLTLPSKPLNNTRNNKNIWGRLPLQAEEAIPTTYEWWPWKVNGLILNPLEASQWLSRMPLSGHHSDFSEEILWWTHFERWILNLIANGLWLPQVECNAKEDSQYQALWIPLLNHENERKRLEQFVKNMPLATICALPWIDKNQDKKSTNLKEHLPTNPLASFRPRDKHLEVMNLLGEILDAQLRNDFQPKTDGLDPLLTAWQQALGSPDGKLNLSEENAKRLKKASKNWQCGLSTNVRSAKTCLELKAPKGNKELWKLDFLLQAEANPEVKLPASQIWEAGSEAIHSDDITIEEPNEILLEGLGRALKYFPTIERGLENSMPNSMELSPTEAFLLIRTATTNLRNIGISVILPPSLSNGLASRLGIAIKAELPENSQGVMLIENLDWSWELMIGGITLTMKELERLSMKNSPLVRHKDTWIELRPNDLKNAEKFFSNQPKLNLNEALNLIVEQGSSLQKLTVHKFEAGPRLQNVLEQYHHQKEPEPLIAPNDFHGQLRPYQERGLGWLAFLKRFNQGACLADDMGLGKTIQLLAFLQHLKNQKELSKPILIIAPTSVLTNWKRETLAFTPKLSLVEHYGPKRSSTTYELKKTLKGIDIFLTSYGLVSRDSDLLKTVDWQGIVIDEAQVIKNPKTKHSLAIREISKNLTSNPLRVALTGTPVENRASELWALMNFLNPTVLGDEGFFNQRYKLPIEHYGDISSLTDLKRRISPFILRRLKTDQSIISDLPKKIELNEWITLSTEQELLYKKTVEESLYEIASTSKGQRQGKTLGLLIRLKQICNHPALLLKEESIDAKFLERSAKLQRLEEILEEIIESNERALLFTQFSEWGHLLQKYYQQKWQSEIPFLHGGTSKTSRQRMIDRFQKDPRGPQIFILSLRAGGLGLNLTRANHVIHIDRWWNPAIENQATDRTYRIGQNKTVIVHKFITTGSIEEKINQMIIRKSKLASDIVGSGENLLANLSFEDLSELVSLNNDGHEF